MLLFEHNNLLGSLPAREARKLAQIMRQDLLRHGVVVRVVDWIAFPQTRKEIPLLLLGYRSNALAHRAEVLRRVSHSIPELAPWAAAARQSLDRGLECALLIEIDSVVALDSISKRAPGCIRHSSVCSIRVADPTKKVALFIIDQEPVEIVSAEAPVAPALEGQVEQGWKCATRGLVSAGVSRYREA
jgi:hypothetical protein